MGKSKSKERVKCCTVKQSGGVEQEKPKWMTKSWFCHILTDGVSICVC